MKLGSLVLLSVLFLGAVPAFAETKPQNYVFFNLDRGAIRRAWFADQNLFAGAQLKYTWKELEPEKDRYDFRQLLDDLAFLQSRHKGLVLQLQDVSFDPGIVNVPEYLRRESEFHGGADMQYSFSDDRDGGKREAGWVARRWDGAVAARFHRLLEELGRRLDGKVVGIVLPETSVDFGQTGKYYPSGFTPPAYRDAIVANMRAARAAFARSTIIQYANFMPGEWLPWDDRGYLASIFETGRAIGVGLGGPDIIPYRKGQMSHGYKFAQQYRGKVTLGFAVQEGNYAARNARTGRAMTVQDIYLFARDTLGADFVFWYPEEPYFTRDLIPYLRSLGP